jgi:hypothetical protein
MAKNTFGGSGSTTIGASLILLSHHDEHLGDKWVVIYGTNTRRNLPP